MPGESCSTPREIQNYLGRVSGPLLDRIARKRFKDKPKITCNARMGSRELKSYCALTEQTLELLKFAMSDLNLSARAYDRILKVARSIADLAGSENILDDHVSRSYPVPFFGPAVVDVESEPKNENSANPMIFVMGYLQPKARRQISRQYT